jgi:dTDP-glucose 4,6-dehydratase
VERRFQNILVTGGAGFIGSNFIRYLLDPATGYAGRIVNADKLTYAGNLASLSDITAMHGDGGTGRYFFERTDICDKASIDKIFERYSIDAVVHFAAESHVDRSISCPEDFVRTNLMGTFILLEAAKTAWSGREDVLFHHISTDEVFGSLDETGYFTEDTPYDPRSPYSASKAGSDHLAAAYWHTFGLPMTMTNCSNNYGPFQFPEKLIPLMLLNMMEGKDLPVYGDGTNVRDWLYVEDHCSAIWTVMRKADSGSKYNVGGENEWKNIELLNRLIAILAKETGMDEKGIVSSIRYVKDRPGHDKRYAIDCSKLKRELGWERAFGFEAGLERTVRWYLDNGKWVEGVRTGSYKEWMETNYSKR